MLVVFSPFLTPAAAEIVLFRLSDRLAQLLK